MYKLTSFAGTTLPAASAEADISTAPAQAAILAYPGGLIDADGSGNAERQLPYPLPYRCEVIGNNLTTLRAEVDALRTLVTQSGALVRTALDNGATHSATTRLLQVRELRQPRNVYVQPLDLNFLVTSNWRGAAYNTWTLITAATQATQLSNNGKLNVEDAIITITAGAAPLVEVGLAISGLSDITYLGTIAATKTLVLDCGKWTVYNDGVGDINGLQFNPAHSIFGFMRVIGAGAPWVTITASSGYAGGDARVDFDYYEQYA